MTDLPRRAATRGLSVAALHALLETDYQLLLPALPKCPKHYLKQVVRRQKRAIHRVNARHFHLTESHTTKTRALEKLARDCEALRPYLPDERIEDRDWLVQVMATMQLNLVLHLQLEVLKAKNRPGKEGKVQ